MAWLKKNFSILEGRENTAITGFSMGGREALAIGLAHPELFAYIGAIAPAPGLTPNYMHRISKKLIKLLIWIFGNLV